jgi:hypothetical protein
MIVPFKGTPVRDFFLVFFYFLKLVMGTNYFHKIKVPTPRQYRQSYDVLRRYTHITWNNESL